MKKVIGLLVVIAVLLTTGCGYLDRFGASALGKPFETCYDGVIYLQFTSGATVKYLPNGKIATCQ